MAAGTARAAPAARGDNPRKTPLVGVAKLVAAWALGGGGCAAGGGPVAVVWWSPSAPLGSWSLPGT